MMSDSDALSPLAKDMQQVREVPLTSFGQVSSVDVPLHHHIDLG